MENVHAKKTNRKKQKKSELLSAQMREINNRLQQIKLNRITGSTAFQNWKEENPKAKLTDFYKELQNEEQGLLRRKAALRQLTGPTLAEIENIENFQQTQKMVEIYE